MNKKDLFNAEQLRDNIVADCDYLICLYRAIYGDLIVKNEKRKSFRDSDILKYTMRKTVNKRAVAFIHNLRAVSLDPKCAHIVQKSKTKNCDVSFLLIYNFDDFKNYAIFASHFYDLVSLDKNYELCSHINEVYKRIKHNFDLLTTEYIK